MLQNPTIENNGKITTIIMTSAVYTYIYGYVFFRLKLS